MFLFQIAGNPSFVFIWCGSAEVFLFQIAGNPSFVFIWCGSAEVFLFQIAGNPSFVFIWCGSAEGLDEGRECLRRWGFRRCEDICWIKTNKNKPGNTSYLEPKALFQHTKEHCLMGIKVCTSYIMCILGADI